MTEEGLITKPVAWMYSDGIQRGLDFTRFTDDDLAEGVVVTPLYTEEAVEALRDTLQTLHDVQNGPPLEEYREAWEKAMGAAESLLATGGGYDNS